MPGAICSVYFPLKDIFTSEFGYQPVGDGLNDQAWEEMYEAATPAQREQLDKLSNEDGLVLTRYVHIQEEERQSLPYCVWQVTVEVEVSLAEGAQWTGGPIVIPHPEKEYEGTEGQDRESYSDTQDRENYTIDEDDEEDEFAEYSSWEDDVEEWGESLAEEDDNA